MNEPGDAWSGTGLVAKGTHLLSVNVNSGGGGGGGDGGGTNDHAMSVMRPLAEKFFMAPWLILAATEQSAQEWAASFRTQVMFLLLLHLLLLLLLLVLLFLSI